jgi:hypothetical protein
VTPQSTHLLRQLLRGLRALVEDGIHDFVRDSDEFNECISMTNAVGFGITEYDLIGAELRDSSLRLSVAYLAEGDQKEERCYCGDCVRGVVELTVKADGGVRWDSATAEITDPYGSEDLLPPEEDFDE